MSQNKRQPTIDELNSSCFHHEQKGCDIARFGLRLVLIEEQAYELSDRADEVLGTKNRPPNKIKCRTHRVVAWACGWEIGLHGGEMSPGYDHNAYNKS